jgi:hypothetical protein
VKVKDNLKTDIKETEYESVEWIHLAQCRGQWWALVNTVLNLRLPRKTGNVTIGATISLYKYSICAAGSKLVTDFQTRNNTTATVTGSNTCSDVYGTTYGLLLLLLLFS